MSNFIKKKGYIEYMIEVDEKLCAVEEWRSDWEQKDNK